MTIKIHIHAGVTSYRFTATLSVNGKHSQLDGYSSTVEHWQEHARWLGVESVMGYGYEDQ